jgi:sugar lactone lactonase YvrE
MNAMRRPVEASVRLLCGLALVAGSAFAVGCSGDETNGGGGTGASSAVGTFSGLFDDAVTGFNFPLDIAIVGREPAAAGGIERGDILVANYGTSEVLLAADPSGPVENRQATAFYDGSASGLLGATSVAMTPDGHVWASFEQGGDGNGGAIAVLDSTGAEVALLDGTTEAGALARPGGICYGGTVVAPFVTRLFFINMDDGTAWRVDADDAAGAGATLTRVASGLATGTAGTPGTPGNEIGSNDLPEGGARGCAYAAGRLYVADAQNARVVRIDDADTAVDADPIPLEQASADYLTYPTGVSINAEGHLIVISYDNAKAFVALGTPQGQFIDNGLYNLNVNSGNHGLQVAEDTIWFTRANNSNGALRAITTDQQHPPSTAGEFPVQ